MTKKSLLIGVGSIALATTPVFAIVSCSSSDGESNYCQYVATYGADRDEPNELDKVGQAALDAFMKKYPNKEPSKIKYEVIEGTFELNDGTTKSAGNTWISSEQKPDKDIVRSVNDPGKVRITIIEIRDYQPEQNN